MKNIILLIVFMSLSFIGLTQKTKSVDTSELCIPYNVAQQMLIDLNEYDKLKELSKLDKEEIYQLNNKIVYMEKTISTWEQKDTLNKDIILNVEEKFKIVNNQNEDLR